MAQTTLTATNTFGEGLIMDLAPNNTQANQLTSALNATLITYNGNEFSLQNDMGNGRVETARLPEGYIPVGSCELGGIIYVASYNPITNKSLLGSFPSPERNVSSEEQNLNTISWKESDLLEPLDTYKKVVTSSKLYNLGLKLNPGDEFKVFTETRNEFEFLYVSIQDNNEYFELGKYTKLDKNSNYLIYDAKTSGTLGLLISVYPIYNEYNITYDIIDENTLLLYFLNYELHESLSFAYLKNEEAIVIEDYDYVKKGFFIENSSKEKVTYIVYPIIKNIIRTDLATLFVIDFSKIGTGNLEMTRWKYYVEENYVSLDFTLNHYPKPNLTVNSLKLTLTDFFDTSIKHEIEWKSLKSGSGNFKKDIYFDKINKDSLYLVDLQLLTSEGNSTINKSLFTSTLFNDYYSDITILDFNTIKPKLSTTLLDESLESVTSEFSKLIPPNNQEFTSVYKHLGVLVYKNKYTVNLKHKLRINDPIFSKVLNLSQLKFEYKSSESSIDNSSEDILDESGIHDSDRFIKSIIKELPIIPTENPWDNENSYTQYVDSISSNISSDNILTINTVANSKVGARVILSTAIKSILKPLIYSLDTAANYGIAINKWLNKGLNYSEQNPVYRSLRLNLSPNYVSNYYTFMGYYSHEDSGNKRLEYGTIGFSQPYYYQYNLNYYLTSSNYTTQNIFNRTEILNLFKKDLNHEYTIFPVLLGFISAADTVSTIATSGINNAFYFPKDNWKDSSQKIAESTLIGGVTTVDNYIINGDSVDNSLWNNTQLLATDLARFGNLSPDNIDPDYNSGFGYGYPRVVMMFMKDLEDNIYPLNFFGYYCRFAESSIFSNPSYNNNRIIYMSNTGAVEGSVENAIKVHSISMYDPIFSLLTQIFKYEYDEEITSNVINDLIYQNEHNVIYTTSIAYKVSGSANLINDFTNIKKYIGDNLDYTIIGLGDIKYIELQHNLKKSSKSLCDDFRLLKTIGEVVCELAAKNTYGDLIRKEFNTTIEKNTPYYIHKQSNGELQLRLMDKGFVFNDYIADIELDGDYIYTNWLGPNEVLRSEEREVIKTVEEAITKSILVTAHNLSKDDVGKVNGIIEFGLDIPKGDLNMNLKSIKITLIPDQICEYKSSSNDNGTIKICQDELILRNVAVSYKVRDKFPKIPNFLTFLNVYEFDTIRIHFSNATDKLRSEISGETYTNVSTYSSNLDYVDVRYDRQSNSSEFSSLLVRIPQELLISTIEIQSSGGMFGNQESFTTVWDLSRLWESQSLGGYPYVKTNTGEEGLIRTYYNDRGTVSGDTYQYTIYLKAENLLYELRENGLYGTCVVGTLTGDPVKVTTTITLDFDGLNLDKTADKDLVIEVPIFCYSNTDLSFLNSTLEAVFVNKKEIKEIVTEEFIEFNSTVNGIGAYLTLDSSGYLRLNNSAKNGATELLHIRGKGWTDESLHVRWGYNSALKISNEYAR